MENITGDAEDNWVLYPSITSGDVFLESKNELTAALSLFNHLGQPVPARIPVSFSHYLRFDVSDLPNGMYVLKIADARGTKQATRKFVKR